MNAPPIASELASIVGERHCISDAALLEPYLEEPRGRYHGQARLLASPADAAETAAVLACCNQRGVGVVPVAGRTGLCGGTHSQANEILLSLHRQNRVRGLDGGCLTAEAGCVLATLQEYAEEAGLLFPLSLGSEGSCQLGGVLSTNAGGIHVLRYGMARQMVVGLEVALPDGRLLSDLKPLAKDNTGYDVKQLFLGSEGTLGIITAATIRLPPRPRAWITALVGVATPDQAVSLYRSAESAFGDELNACELISRAAGRLCESRLQGVAIPGDIGAPWLLCLELAGAGPESVLYDRLIGFLEGAEEQGELLDAVCAASEAQREAIWRLRHGVPEALRRSGPSLHHDLGVPPERIADFLRLAGKVCQEYLPGAEALPFGHVGDGNMHLPVLAPPGSDPDRFFEQGRRVSAELRELAWSMDGSFSAEHGVGVLLKEELERLGDPVKLEVMRALKRAMDPRGIMNPGKVLSA